LTGLCKPYQPNSGPTYDITLSNLFGAKAYTWTDTKPGKSWMMTGVPGNGSVVAYCDGFMDDRTLKTYHLASFDEVKLILQHQNTPLGYQDPWAGWLALHPASQNVYTSTPGAPQGSYPTTRALQSGGVADRATQVMIQEASGPNYVEIYFICTSP
jgi:hypothetical protein